MQIRILAGTRHRFEHFVNFVKVASVTAVLQLISGLGICGFFTGRRVNRCVIGEGLTGGKRGSRCGVQGDARPH